jgi:hypothetical protein
MPLEHGACWRLASPVANYTPFHEPAICLTEESDVIARAIVDFLRSASTNGPASA